jgi:hypothetical protein
MRLRKLKDTILPAEGQAVNAMKNEEAFAELIQFLDDRSLSLVMRDTRHRPKGVENSPRTLRWYWQTESPIAVYRTDIVAKIVVGNYDGLRDQSRNDCYRSEKCWGKHQ